MKRSLPGIRGVILLSLLVLAGCTATNEPSPARRPVADVGTWLNRAPMPTARQELSAAVISGQLLLPGGFDEFGRTSAAFEIYDPASDSWQSGPPMLFGRHHAPAAAVGDELYVLGGYSGSFEPKDEVMMYSMSTNQWAVVDTLPERSGAGIAVPFAGKVYVFGGRKIDPESPTLAVSTSTFEFDPGTVTITRRADMPTGREHLAAAVIDSLIYVIGGRVPAVGGVLNLATLEAYSPATNSWTSLPPMPTPRGGLAAAALGGKLYVFGGEIPGVFPTVEEYDPATRQWREVRGMPTPRHGQAAATVGDSIYVIGGGTIAGLGASSANEVFTIP